MISESLTLTGSSATRIHPVYARLVVDRGAQAGHYTDLIPVTLTY